MSLLVPLSLLSRFTPRYGVLFLAFCTALLGVAAPSIVTAGESSGKAVINDAVSTTPSSWCDILNRNTLYEGEGLIRSIRLNGRYHGRYVSQSKDYIGRGANPSEGYHDYDNTSFRLGATVEFDHDLTFTTMINIGDGFGGAGSHGLTYGTFIDDLSDFYFTWAPESDFYVRFGKFKQSVMREYEASLNKILTIERSAITNLVSGKKPWGVAVGYKMWGLSQELGAWMVGGDRDSTGERWDWLDPDSRGSLTYRASLNVSEITSLHFDYQYTDNHGGHDTPAGSADFNLGSAFEHVAAIGTESKKGRFGLITDLIFAQNGMAAGPLSAGYDTWGAVFIPYWDITDKLQFVTRYAFMNQGSEQLPQRFEKQNAVRDYHTIYTGLTYRFCGDQMKIMMGHEYAFGDLVAGPTDKLQSSSWILALRTFW